MKVNIKIDNDAVEKLLDMEVIHHIDKDVGQIVDDAKSLVPVDTGKLKSSISKIKDENDKWKVIADTSYAWIVEMGGRHQPAQPYLRPALLNMMRKYEE